MFLLPFNYLQINLENGQCSHRPVPDCQRVGQSGALDGSSNHYFVCLSKHGALTPQIFLCPHGWHFSNGFCRPYIEISTSTTTEKVETTESRTEEITEQTIWTTSRIDQFFSTDKPVTYAADMFLADKFDLSNYETIDETPSLANDFLNSFEENVDFW